MIAPARLPARRRREWPLHTVRNIKWATSERTGWALARHAAPVLRPVMRRAADRLWRDDLAYAERRYRLRSG
jgi:hypothetical protein